MRKNGDQANGNTGGVFCWGAATVSGRDNDRAARSRATLPMIAAVLVLAMVAFGCSSSDDISPLNGSQAGSTATFGVSGAGATAAMGGTGAVGGIVIAQGGTAAKNTTDTSGVSSKAGTGAKSGSVGAAGKGKTNTAGAAGKVGKAGAAGNASGSAGSTGSILPPVDSTDADGPFKTAPEDLASGPSGTSGVFRPAELGKDGLKHPIFIWSCGGGTAPNSYIWHFNRIASHGFVVVADDPPTPATGAKLIASMDWIIKENDRKDSIFYQKLDTTKIGIGGHSMGSLNTLIAGSDPRVGTTVNVCGGSGSGTTGAAKYHAPALYLGEVNEGGTANFDADFAATPSPEIFLIHESTNNNLNDHIMCARDNMPAWIAWLRWILAGESNRKPDFFDGGAYCKSPWAECRNKNW
jgi:hypothetical protein